jgi:hypothetical protein
MERAGTALGAIARIGQVIEPRPAEASPCTLRHRDICLVVQVAAGEVEEWA